MAGWPNAATPNTATTQASPIRLVARAHVAKRGVPRRNNVAARATKASIPTAAPAMLFTRCEIRNESVVTYRLQAAKCDWYAGWCVIVPRNSRTAHNGRAQSPRLANKAMEVMILLSPQTDP